MTLTPTQDEEIIMMKVQITSALQKINKKAVKLNLIHQRLILLEKTEPTDSFGDKLSDQEITKFHSRAKAEFEKIFPPAKNA